MSEATSHIQELEELAETTNSVWFQLDFKKPKGSYHCNATISIDASNPKKVTIYSAHYDASAPIQKWVNFQPKTLIDAFAEIAQIYPKAKLDLAHVQVNMSKKATTKISTAKFKPIVVQAWYEATGQPIPTIDVLKQAEKESKAKKKAGDEEIIEGLRDGSGIDKFNKMSDQKKSLLNLSKIDLSGCNLAGVKFEKCGKLSEANFSNADLTGADLNNTSLMDCDFSNAKLTGANLLSTQCKDTNFANADLTGANLQNADIRGANLSGATLDKVEWNYGPKFDHETKWPKGFKIPMELEWKGVGPDPRLVPSKSEKKLPKPTDFPAFLERLKNATDTAKLDKALKMLKAERFNLFAKVSDAEMVGVVKSQSDPDLVYSCRLASDGSYSCCTQNLNVCGGLRGSPCKHLLVLIVGLTKAGELDPATAHEWSQSTRGRKAELDKDAMTETLLQYKGAEAGEIDWRPTETLPEDFYAM